MRYPLTKFVLCTSMAIVLMGGGYLFQARCATSSNDYQLAVQAMNRKDYRNAFVYYARAASADQRNGDAYAGAIRSALALGRHQDAALWARSMQNHFRSGSFAIFASEVLHQEGATGSTPAATFPAAPSGRQAPNDNTYDDENDPDSPTTGMTAEKKIAYNRLAHPTALTKDFHVSGGARVDLDKMIIVVEPLGNHPRVNHNFVNDVLEVLKQAPQRPIAYLYKAGCRVYVTPTAIDHDPDLAKTHPSGYEDGATFANVPAYFDGSNLIVCQYHLGEDHTSFQENSDPIHSFRHELGHAVDYYLGNLSSEKDYQHIYTEEAQALDASARSTLAYFLQAGGRGRAETFAELFARMIGGGSSHGYNYINDKMGQAFSQLYAHIEKRLRELNA